MIKNLRGEKDYYIKQGECLSKELEQAKQLQVQVATQQVNMFN